MAGLDCEAHRPKGLPDYRQCLEAHPFRVREDFSLLTPVGVGQDAPLLHPDARVVLRWMEGQADEIALHGSPFARWVESSTP